MNIQKELEKEGIEVITQIDDTISNHIAKNIARRIVESFPDYPFNEESLYSRLSNLTMYRAKMIEGMAEANYYYKNTSIYFNEHIDYEDLEEFAIHECIHYLQEIKDEKNNLLRLGLSTYSNGKPKALALNEAAVQYTASYVIGIEPDFEKYFGISLYTPSPSYYPLECSLLNQIIYFTGNDVLFKSTLFSNDNFKNEIVKRSSEKTYIKIQNLFDSILKSEELITKLSNNISLLQDGDAKIDKINNKIDKMKNKIANDYINTQNIIIKNFFDLEFQNISNLEELENFRRKLYNFSDIIGSTSNYNYFDNYYTETMNKLEHKCNILENGGVETAIAKKHTNPIMAFLKKILNFNKTKHKKENI